MSLKRWAQQVAKWVESKSTNKSAEQAAVVEPQQGGKVLGRFSTFMPVADNQRSETDEHSTSNSQSSYPPGHQRQKTFPWRQKSTRQRRKSTPLRQSPQTSRQYGENKEDGLTIDIGQICEASPLGHLLLKCSDYYTGKFTCAFCVEQYTFENRAAYHCGKCKLYFCVDCVNEELVEKELPQLENKFALDMDLPSLETLGDFKEDDGSFESKVPQNGRPSRGHASSRTHKHHEESDMVPLKVSFCSEQGVRMSMEDEVLIIGKYHIEDSVNSEVSCPLSIFGVFDGHAGRDTAVFLKTEFPIRFKRHLEKGPVFQAFERTFAEMEEELVTGNLNDDSGSTAVVLLIEHKTKKIRVANIGDSRCFLCRNGEVISLTDDHKPMRPDEWERIMENNGHVMSGRVMNELAVSRCIGDAIFKRTNPGMVIAEPEMKSESLSDDDSFLCLASDGLWDILSPEEVVEFYRKQKKAKQDTQQICKGLVEKAIADGSFDNVSVILVELM